MIYFQKISRSGTANTTEYDDGLESSKENPKRLLSIIAQIDEHQGAYVQGWWEREKIFDLPDVLIDTYETHGTDKAGKSFNRLNEIEVGHDLPAGSTFKLALKCGASANNFKGAYRYEIVK